MKIIWTDYLKYRSHKRGFNHKAKVKKYTTKMKKLGNLIETLNNSFYKDLSKLHKDYILEVSRKKRTKNLKIKQNVENITNLFNKNRCLIIEEYKKNINKLSNAKNLSNFERKLKSSKAKKVIKNIMYYFRKNERNPQ